MTVAVEGVGQKTFDPEAILGDVITGLDIARAAVVTAAESGSYAPLNPEQKQRVTEMFGIISERVDGLHQILTVESPAANTDPADSDPNDQENLSQSLSGKVMRMSTRPAVGATPNITITGDNKVVFGNDPCELDDVDVIALNILLRGGDYDVAEVRELLEAMGKPLSELNLSFRSFQTTIAKNIEGGRLSSAKENGHITYRLDPSLVVADTRPAEEPERPADFLAQ